MKRNYIASLLLAALSVAPAVYGQSGSAADLFNNTNVDAVSNGGKEPSFQLVATAQVTELVTYHWNDQRGAAPGTIALRASSGQVFGPFPAKGTPGSYNVPNVNWVADVNLLLPAGSYTVVDSDPATWSYNTESKLFGFAIVRGDYQLKFVGGKFPTEEPVAGPTRCVVMGAPTILYTNSNIFAVNNAPTGRTAFTLARPACITQVDDYHFNYGAGAAPAGTISLDLQTGGQLRVFGPFQASATDGTAKNVNWVAPVNEILPAGSYFVFDSEPSTWSQNAQSAYRGFTTVWGTYLSSSQPATPIPPPAVAPAACPALLGPGRDVALRAFPTSGPAPLTVTFTLCQNVSSFSTVTDWTLGPLSIPGAAQYSGAGTPPTMINVTYTGPGVSSPDFCVDNATHTGGCAALPSPIVIK